MSGTEVGYGATRLSRMTQQRRRYPSTTLLLEVRYWYRVGYYPMSGTGYSRVSRTEIGSATNQCPVRVSGGYYPMSGTEVVVYYAMVSVVPEIGHYCYQVRARMALQAGLRVHSLEVSSYPIRLRTCYEMPGPHTPTFATYTRSAVLNTAYPSMQQLVLTVPLTLCIRYEMPDSQTCGPRQECVEEIAKLGVVRVEELGGLEEQDIRESRVRLNPLQMRRLLTAIQREKLAGASTAVMAFESALTLDAAVACCPWKGVASALTRTSLTRMHLRCGVARAEALHSHLGAPLRRLLLRCFPVSRHADDSGVMVWVEGSWFGLRGHGWRTGGHSRVKGQGSRVKGQGSRVRGAHRPHQARIYLSVYWSVTGPSDEIRQQHRTSPIFRTPASTICSARTPTDLVSLLSNTHCPAPPTLFPLPTCNAALDLTPFAARQPQVGTRRRSHRSQPAFALPFSSLSRSPAQCSTSASARAAPPSRPSSPQPKAGSTR
eukprot:1313830-Rhodomonas_salina.4